MSQLANLDWSILNHIHSLFDNSFLDTVMPKITALGNAGAIWIICALIFISLKRYRRQGLLLLIGLAIGAVIGNIILKNAFDRSRPCWINQDFPLLIPVPADYSFPSGHTLSSFLAATILGRFDRRFRYVAFPLACLIAFSRLYLYVHFPSDVLAGAAIGTGLGFLTISLGSKIWRSDIEYA